MKVVLDMPIEHSSRYLLVYSDTPNTDLLTISRNEVTLKKFEKNVEEIFPAEKFRNIGNIIFATSIQKNEGVYILIITDSYEIYIDRYDQIISEAAPLIQTNLTEFSELNNKFVSATRLEELIDGITLKYDDNYKMLYLFLHDKKKMLAWFINDMLRNSRFY